MVLGKSIRPKCAAVYVDNQSVLPMPREEKGAKKFIVPADACKFNVYARWLAKETATAIPAMVFIAVSCNLSTRAYFFWIINFYYYVDIFIFFGIKSSPDWIKPD